MHGPPIRFRIQLLAAAWCSIASLIAHPVSQVAVDADVHTNHIRIGMEVKAEDLVWFHHPDGTNQVTISARLLRTAAQKHEPILRHGFRILDAQGRTLHGEQLAIDTTRLGNTDLTRAELSTATVHYTFNHPLNQPPTFLTFLQRFGGADPPVPTMMDLTVRREGRWIGKPVNLNAGIPHSVELDWTTAPPTSLLEIHRRNAARHQQRLGIPNFAGLRSFIHIEPHRVRHEILLPLHQLADWIPVDHTDPDFITVDEQAALRPLVLAFFQTNSPVTINGQSTTPTLARCRCHGLETIDLHTNAPPRRLSRHQARIAIVLNYPAKTPISRLRVNWYAFSKQVPFIKSVVYAPDTEPRHTYFTAQRPLFQWQGKPPATKPNPFQILLRELSNQLHVVANESLLPQLHPPTSETITSARLLNTRRESANRFTATWTLQTATDHWGHRHETRREYTAAIILQDERITTLRITNQSMGQSKTSLREVNPTPFIRAR